MYDVRNGLNTGPKIGLFRAYLPIYGIQAVYREIALFQRYTGPVPVYALYIGKYRPVYTVYIGCIAV